MLISVPKSYSARSNSNVSLAEKIPAASTLSAPITSLLLLIRRAFPIRRPNPFPRGRRNTQIFAFRYSQRKCLSSIRTRIKCCVAEHLFVRSFAFLFSKRITTDWGYESWRKSKICREECSPAVAAAAAVEEAAALVGKLTNQLSIDSQFSQSVRVRALPTQRLSHGVRCHRRERSNGYRNARRRRRLILLDAERGRNGGGVSCLTM